MIRIVIGLTVGVALGVAIAAWVLAGRAEGPTVDILRPTTFIGRTATFEATVDAPDANLTIFDAHLEQNSSAHEIFFSSQWYGGYRSPRIRHSNTGYSHV